MHRTPTALRAVVAGDLPGRWPPKDGDQMTELQTQESQKNGPAESEPCAPQWALAPFRRFLDQTERLGQIIHLSQTGISMLQGVPRAVEVLANVRGGSDSDEVRSRLERATREAELAKRELATDFPLVHAQAVVTIWSYLEALSRTFVSEWLRNQPGALSVDEVARIKIKFAEYERLTQEERYLYLFDLLEQELASNLRVGVTRFEVLLAPFGLSGPVPDHLSRPIFELGQVRNAIVHRGISVDRRLVVACPWLNLKPGDPISVSGSMLWSYFNAVHEYVTVLIKRVGAYFGVDMEENEVDREREHNRG